MPSSRSALAVLPALPVPVPPEAEGPVAVDGPVFCLHVRVEAQRPISVRGSLDGAHARGWHTRQNGVCHDCRCPVFRGVDLRSSAAVTPWTRVGEPLPRKRR